MTVCIAVAVYDGLVFATHSAVTVMEDGHPDKVSNVYRHGHKLFNFHRRLPIVAMTSGLAAIDGIPMKSLAKDFRVRMERGDIVNVEKYTLEEVASAARAFFFEEHYAKAGFGMSHTLRFWIGGYSAPRDKHELFTFTMMGEKCEPPQKSLIKSMGMGVTWGTPGSGEHDPLHRLLMGYSEDIERRLKQKGMSEKQVHDLLAPSEVGLWHPGMPIQDAIDLANYLVEVTKQYFRFLPGADIVGGDTDIAVVTRYENFKWIQRKRFYPAHLNPIRRYSDEQSNHVEEVAP